MIPAGIVWSPRDGGKRLRRIGIVALARRLAIALWRYVNDGLIPDGAQLKPIGG
jgi:transposase